MKLYCMPGACSIGIHVLLEIGEAVRLAQGRWRQAGAVRAQFVKLNRSQGANLARTTARC